MLCSPQTISITNAHRSRNFRLLLSAESCDLGLLLKANDLSGLARPIVLGPTVDHAVAEIARLCTRPLDGLVICEDIIGTGRQAGRILKAVETNAPVEWMLMFVPLIAFEAGLRNIQNNYARRSTVQPVVVLPEKQCLRREPLAHEPQLFKAIRGIVKKTTQLVLEPNDSLDDPPKDPFGYENSGGLLVTCHNSPNNSLPLIHHKAPMWNPLFRRLHHTERK